MGATTSLPIQEAEEKSPQSEDIRALMHRAIDQRDHLQVQHCLRDAEHLRFWLQPMTEESALHRAVETNAFHIYGLLLSDKCRFKDEEEQKCLHELNPVQQSELERQREFVTRYPDFYMHYLKSCAESQSKHEDFHRKVSDMLSKLNNIELIRPLLKAAASSDHLIIRFDFERDNVECLTGRLGGQDSGCTNYRTRTIFVGAKTEGTTDVSPEVLGTLAHEICHLVLHLVYRNGGKPYLPTDVEKKRRYEKVINDTKKSEALHPKINVAFDYDTEQELIVRVPHILALHGSPGEGEAILQRQTPKLLEFYEEHVIPDVIKYTRDLCPPKDVENVRSENERLGKSRETELLRLTFETPFEYQTWKGCPLLLLAGPDLPLLESLVNDAVSCAVQSYLFCEASKWDDHLQDVLLVNKCNVVLVTCDAKEEFARKLELLGEISDVVGTQVILLVPEHDREYFARQADNVSFFSGKYSEAFVDEASVENVSERFKTETWRRSSVRFQGSKYQMPLEKIVDLDTLLRHTNTTSLLALRRCGCLEVGPPLPEPRRDITEYYVKRRLKRLVEFNAEKIREDNPDEAFVFYGCSERTTTEVLPSNQRVLPASQLQDFHKFLHLSDDDYDVVTRNPFYGNKTVHLLQHSGEVSSGGNASEFPFVEVLLHDEESLLEVRDQVVVVCGAPGTGKTVLAHWLSTQLKERRKTRWVIHINIPERITSVSVRARTPDLLQLAILSGVKVDGFEFFLFKQSVETGSPCETVLIFDAFDEVNALGRDYILDMIRWLRQTKVLRTYVFSRTIFKAAIQNAADALVLELDSCSGSVILEYMTKYWKKNGAADASQEELHVVAEKVFNMYRAAIGPAALKTPLLIQMIVEQEQGSLFDKKINRGVSGPRSKFEIYKQFVDYKYRIYAKEKLQSDLSTLASAAGFENDYSERQFYYKLGLLAVSVIFGEETQDVLTEEEARSLHPDRSLMKDVAESRLGHGFVENFSEESPRFIHKTFAEFFAAHFLYRKIQRSRNDGLMKFVLGMYGNDDFCQVVYFLDSFAAATYPLHTILVNANVSYESMTGAERGACELDGFGRTSLHAAALYARPYTLKHIRKNSALVWRDKFGMTPLMYADRLRSWRTLDIFCSNCPSDVDIDWEQELPTALNNLREVKELERSVLYHAVQSSLYSLLGVLLGQFCIKRHQGPDPRRVDVDVIKDGKGKTILFYAESEAVLELLLPYCDVSAVTEQGRTPLQDAILDASIRGLHERRLGTFGRVSPLELVKLRLVHFPTILPEKSVETALHTCVKGGQTELVKVLLLRSCTSIEDRRGRTPLQLALESNAPPFRTLTATHQAETVDLLLPHTSITNSRNPLYLFSTESMGLLKPLCKHAEDVLVSLYHSSKKLYQIMSNSKAGSSYQEAFGALFPYLKTGNIRSCIPPYANNLTVLKHLLLHIDVSSSKRYSTAALHQCAKLASVDAVKLLLPHSDIRMKDKKGRTAYRVALEYHGGEHHVTQVLSRWGERG